MKEKVLQVFRKVEPRIDYEVENKLFTNKLLDSMQMVDIILALSEEFDVEFDYKKIIPEYFDSMEKVILLITEMKGKDL